VNNPSGPRLPYTSSVEMWTKRNAACSASGRSVRWRRAVSSSTCVPITLVRMKSAASSMERSTCVSAAKFTSAQGRWARSTCSTVAVSAMSPSMKA